MTDQQLSMLEKLGLRSLEPCDLADNIVFEKFETSKIYMKKIGTYEEFKDVFCDVLIGQSLIADRNRREEDRIRNRNGISKLQDYYSKQLLKRSGHPVNDETMDLKKSIVLTKRFIKKTHEKFKTTSANK